MSLISLAVNPYHAPNFQENDLPLRMQLSFLQIYKSLFLFAFCCHILVFAFWIRALHILLYAVLILQFSFFYLTFKPVQSIQLLLNRFSIILIVILLLFYMLDFFNMRYSEYNTLGKIIVSISTKIEVFGY